MSETGDALYERLRSYLGRVAAEGGRGPDPVNTPMIRHWCEAIGHPVPSDGSAPPTMLQVWTMAGLRGHVSRSGPFDELLGALDAAGYTSVVATDCEQEYLRALYPGDHVAFDAVIESVSPRKTTRLGTGYFVTTKTDVWSGGERIGTHRFRILKYAPGKDASGNVASGKDTSARSASRQNASAEEKGPAEENGSAERDGTAKGANTPAPEKPRAPASRPRPVVNRDNAGFWEGVARHVLLIQRCADCGTLRLPWLPGCNACGSPDWRTQEACGAGTVYSYVVVHHPPFPAFSPPYAVALVELAEGVRIITNITGVPHDKVRVGMPVALEFLTVDSADGVDGELTLPVFRACDDTSGNTSDDRSHSCGGDTYAGR